jgi:hypothetical protein
VWVAHQHITAAFAESATVPRYREAAGDERARLRLPCQAELCNLILRASMAAAPEYRNVYTVPGETARVCIYHSSERKWCAVANVDQALRILYSGILIGTQHVMVGFVHRQKLGRHEQELTDELLAAFDTKNEDAFAALVAAGRDQLLQILQGNAPALAGT